MLALSVDGIQAREPADQEAGVGVEAAPAPASLSPASRPRRLVCDMLPSPLQSAACTASCLAQGKKGGSCQGGTCVCRDRDSSD
ncbi:Defensin-1 [Frankliniella fusca]|uniref:Defensin-1 n=1 Tax=Frankliniella fusca TaxID=407009 RepID=A0AAE1L9B0_9NEOP|nr:Defensin-1 [Frankliniella fusca]